MKTVTKSTITAVSGVISFGVGAWLHLKADSLSTFRIPGGLSQDSERLHALISIASALLWLGVALLVLSAVAWLFFAPTLSSEVSLAAEPVA